MTTATPGPGPGLTPQAVNSLLLDTTPWLSCDDCFTRVDGYVEALVENGAHDDPAMAAHLRGCPACAEEAASLLELVTSTRE